MYNINNEELTPTVSVEEQERRKLVEKLKLKRIKQEWNAQNEHSKRSHPWQLIVKSTCDDIYIGAERCQQFANRVLIY